MNRMLVALSLLVAPALLGATQGLASLDASRALANQATLLLAQERFADGFNVLQPYWPLPEAELQLVIRETTANWSRVGERHGHTRAITYLGEQRLSPTFVRYSYLHRFERGAGQWQFTFQKFRDSWLVDGVTFVEDAPQPHG